MLRVGTLYLDALRPLGGNACSRWVYGETGTQSAEDGRDDAEHRHEVPDGLDECLHVFFRPANEVNHSTMAGGESFLVKWTKKSDEIPSPTNPGDARKPRRAGET